MKTTTIDEMYKKIEKEADFDFSKLDDDFVSLLQNISVYLAHLVFRNGVVEDLHSENCALTDDVMKTLNKDINNRIYTLLYLWYSGDDSYRDSFLKMLEELENIESKWDKAEICKETKYGILSVLNTLNKLKKDKE